MNHFKKHREAQAESGIYASPAPFALNSGKRCPRKDCNAQYFGRLCPFCQPEHGDPGHDMDGGMTHRRIAEELGLSRQRVAQIERDAMHKLRDGLEQRGITAQDLDAFYHPESMWDSSDDEDCEPWADAEKAKA